ncbi:MAG: hypothetical protein AAFV88_06490 [Planctomycetota bacterium]
MSDPQPVTAGLFAMLQSLMPPVAAYNAVAMIILFCNGLAAGWLASTLRCNRPAMVTTILLAVWLPFVASEIGVLQMAIVAPVIATLGWLIRFHHTTQPMDAAKVGVGISICYLTSGYWGLWLALLCLASGVLLIRAGHFRRGPLIGTATAIGIVAVSCGPFVYYQQKFVGDYHWDEKYIDSLSAGVADYLRVGEASVAGKMPWTIDAGEWPIRLYPGALLLIATVIAVGCLLKETRDASSPLSRRWLFVMLLAIQVALVLSFGRIEVLGDGSPMNVLQKLVPGLDKLRSPYRLGMFVSVLMLPLAAIGIDRLWGWSPKLASVVLLLGVAEITPWGGFAAGPTDVAESLETSPAWCAAVIEQVASPEANKIPRAVRRDERIVLLPMAAGASENAESGYEFVCRAMLLQRFHGVPMVGGYSGFFPPEVKALESVTEGFPNGPSAMALLKSGVTLLAVDRERMSPQKFQDMGRLPKLLQRVFVDEKAGLLVYRFTDEALRSTQSAGASSDADQPERRP